MNYIKRQNQKAKHTTESNSAKAQMHNITATIKNSSTQPSITMKISGNKPMK